MRKVLQGLLIAGIIVLNAGVCFAAIPFGMVSDFRGHFYPEEGGRAILMGWFDRSYDKEACFCIDDIHYTEAKRESLSNGAKLYLSNPKQNIYGHTLKYTFINGKKYFVYTDSYRSHSGYTELSTPVIASEKRVPASKKRMPASDVSLGGIAYGSEITYVRSIYGAPTKITTGYDGLAEAPSIQYSYNGTFIIHFIDDKATFMQSTANNGIKTNRGISVGSSFEQLLAAHGNPMRYSKKDGNDACYFRGNTSYGIGYLFGIRNGKVVRIYAGLFD